MDEPSEADEGYVTLVNANVDENGNITESAARTGKWAWKHPHKADGSVTYTLLQGDVRHDGRGLRLRRRARKCSTTFPCTPKPGQKVAFVGATGAGKTTITNLINRFYDIADGKIRYDGININKIKKPDLRRSLGIVLQDTNLFTGTVMENIRYGKLDATDEEVIRRGPAGQRRRLHPPPAPGIRHPADRQRRETFPRASGSCIAIARAAVADPPVMILDEATSSIDTRTELLVQRGMDQLMKGRTVFVIAHRLSTVQQHRRDHGAGPRPHHRAGQPRKAHRRRRASITSSTPALSNWNNSIFSNGMRRLCKTGGAFLCIPAYISQND